MADSFRTWTNKYWQGQNLPIGMYRKEGGFWCRFTERGEDHQRWFGDAKHDGAFNAYVHACDWLRKERRKHRSYWKTAVWP